MNNDEGLCSDKSHLKSKWRQQMLHVFSFIQSHQPIFKITVLNINHTTNSLLNYRLFSLLDFLYFSVEILNILI